MRTIAWKDIRQHLRWALLMLGLTGIALAFALVLVQGSFDFDSYNVSLSASVVQGVTTLASVLWGLALGLLQTLTERKRDLWAFLVHRPVTRGTILRGKWLAGAALYFVPLAVPFSTAAIWSATPGMVAAPFDLRLALPGIADILAGFVFYLATLSTGFRPARWYGSLALAPIGAGACLAIVHLAPSFWMAAVACAVFGIVYAVAGWGNLLTTGVYETQPWVAKLAQVVTVLLGVAVTGTLATTFLGSFEACRGSSKTFAFDKEGHVVISEHESGDAFYVKVTDLDGKLIREYRRSQDYNADVHYGTFLSLVPLGQTDYRGPSHYLLPMGELGVEGIRWYYVVDRGLALGYRRDTRRLAEILGPDGFAAPGETVSRFEGKVVSVHHGGQHLVFSNGIYVADGAAHKLTRIHTSGADEIREAVWYDRTTNGHDRPIVLVAGQKIVVLEPDGKPVLTTPLLHDGPRALALFFPDQERLVVHYEAPDGQPPKERGDDHYISEISLSGGAVKTTKLPPLHQPPEPVSYLDALGGIAWAMGTLEEVSSVLVASILASLASAGLTLWLARRHAFGVGTQVGWTALALLLGPGALLAFLAIREFPARVACPGCARKRVVNRRTCEHCGAGFLAPSRQGIEIFSP